MIACIAASILLWTTQGLGMNLIAANTAQIQGALGATLTETSWLIAAYMAPNVSLTILLVKIRTQFGLRLFAEVGIAIFVLASTLHLFVFDLQSAVAVRFVAGCAASPISTLGFLYMLDAFPQAKKLTWGVSLALTLNTMMPMVARLISPYLLDIEPWRGLLILEAGLALSSLTFVYLLPLTPAPRAKVLHWLDFVSYPLLAIGFGGLAVTMSLGRYYWWFEADWIGILLALSILCIALAAAIEVNRDTPMLNIQWLTSREIVHFAAIMLIFRLALSEQSAGAIGLFQTLGLLNEQSQELYLVMVAASIAGGITCALVLKPDRVPAIHAMALVCIATGAFIDSHATNLTRPSNMYLSQALIAFGGMLFLPPALLVGMTKTLQRGPTFLTSFFAVFLFTQSLGGLMGSALFGTFVTWREKFHSSHLVEHLALTDPVVAGRIRQLATSYGRVIADPQLLNAEGAALLAQQATREANVLAYNDAFLMIAALATVALIALILHALYSRLRLRLAPPQPAAAN
jgi:MFS family permease